MEALRQNSCSQVLSSPKCVTWNFPHHPLAGTGLQFLNQPWPRLNPPHEGIRLYATRSDWRVHLRLAAHHGALLTTLLSGPGSLTGQLLQITAQETVLHRVSQLLPETSL